MTVTNYYLVHKETKKVHFLLKVDPRFLSKDGSPEHWLAGRVYRSDPSWAKTLEEIYALDFSDEYVIPNLECAGDWLFSLYADIDYASVKGYRLFHSGSGLAQVHDDFGGDDIIEMNAFLSTLFMEFIGPEEVERWDDMCHFVDSYGVNEMVMKNFTIEKDYHEGVFYHNSLTDDPNDWAGFGE